jgi:hypothetical protein
MDNKCCQKLNTNSQGTRSDRPLCEVQPHTVLRPILDPKVATVARDIAQLCATFCDFPQLCFQVATVRDFIKIIANNRKTSIHMTSFFFVPRPLATVPPRHFVTFRDLGPRLWPRLCEGRVQDRPVSDLDLVMSRLPTVRTQCLDSQLTLTSRMYVVSLHLVSLGGGAQAHLLEVRRMIRWSISKRTA